MRNPSRQNKMYAMKAFVHTIYLLLLFGKCSDDAQTKQYQSHTIYTFWILTFIWLICENYKNNWIQCLYVCGCLPYIFGCSICPMLLVENSFFLMLLEDYISRFSLFNVYVNSLKRSHHHASPFFLPFFFFFYSIYCIYSKSPFDYTSTLL